MLNYAPPNTPPSTSNPLHTKLIGNLLPTGASLFLLPTPPIILSSSCYPPYSPPPQPDGTPTVPSYILRISLVFSAINLFTPSLFPHEIVICLAVTSFIPTVSFPPELFLGSSTTTSILPRCPLSLGCLLPKQFVISSANY